MRINEAVYDWLESLREEENLTLDQIATAARKYGVNWTAAYVKKIGSSTVSTTLSNLLILVRAVNDLLNETLSLEDMFKGEGKVDLSNATSVSRADLRSMLAGKVVEFNASNSALEAATSAYIQALPTIMGAVSMKIVMSMPKKLRAELNSHAPTLAENRAAKKLGIAPLAFNALCLLKYGRFLEEETAARSGADPTPQKKGRESRNIQEEIDVFVDSLVNDVRQSVDESDADAMLKSFSEGDSESLGLAALEDDNQKAESEGGDGR